MLDEASRRKGISLHVVLDADSIAIQKRVAAKGAAYTVLGPYAMMEDVHAGRLQASRIVDPNLKRFVTLAMPKQGSLTLACKVVMQLIQQTAKELERAGGLRLVGGTLNEAVGKKTNRRTKARG